jgi:signal transduction histidine kinase
MRAHGGTVSVAEAPSGGALFTLRFPEARSENVVA